MATIFTKILNREIPGQIVYEDGDFFAILDIHPKSSGHTLLIPKEEVANLHEVSEELGQKIIPTLQKVSKQIKEKLNADGIKIIQNNGESAGQVVMHLHFHIIPYYLDNTKALAKENLEEIAKKIVS